MERINHIPGWKVSHGTVHWNKVKAVTSERKRKTTREHNEKRIPRIAVYIQRVKKEK